MKNPFHSFSLAIMVMVVIIGAGCATRKASSEAYLGRWRYIVPEQTDNNTGVLIISREGSGYTCLAVTDGGYEQPFETCTIEEGKLSGSYETQGMTVTVEGVFDNNRISGNGYVQGMEFSWSAVKEE